MLGPRSSTAIALIAAAAYLTPVYATVVSVAAIALLALYNWAFPVGASRPKLTEAQRLQWVCTVLAAGAGGDCAYNLSEHLVLEGSPAEGAVTFKLRMTPALHNFFGSMHGGVIASAVDVATTAAIISMGAFPGVSTSLGVSYMAGCGPDDVVRLEPAVLKLGANLAFTECKVFRDADGALMARGWHVKYVVAPTPFAALMRLRPSIISRLLSWALAGPRRTVRLAGRKLTLGTPPPPSPAPPPPFDAAVEPQTGMSRDDAGKRLYFSTFGEAGTPMQGWDAPVQGALVLERAVRGAELERERAGTPEAASAWRLTVGPGHANSFGGLHGGCTASLVDVLGSAQIAFGDELECGVAVGLDVQFSSSAKRGEAVQWTARVLHRGGRLATVEVRATAAGRKGRPGRLIAVGTVTKSLRGLSKAANAKRAAAAK